MGFSQEDLANELDVSRQAVYKWEIDESIPDVNKIKKMAKLFNISLDRLLDDEIDIRQSDGKNENVETQIKKTAYRDVFDSNNKIYPWQAEIDRGYSENRDAKRADSAKVLNDRITKMKSDLEEIGADSYVLLQNDVAGCFFQNTNDMLFGFYYNGSIQFLCPYENYINSNIANSGNNLAFESEVIPQLGFGRNGLSSIGFARIPKAKVSKPYEYYLTIFYFDKSGKVNEYRLTLNCFRKYTLYEIKKKEELVNFQEATSEYTNKRMMEINNKLSAMPAVAAKINSKEISVYDVDIEKIKADYEKSNKLANDFIEDNKINQRKDLVARRKSAFIVIGNIILIIALLMLIGEIVKTSRNKTKGSDYVPRQSISKIENAEKPFMDTNDLNVYDCFKVEEYIV